MRPQPSGCNRCRCATRTRSRFSAATPSDCCACEWAVDERYDDPRRTVLLLPVYGEKVGMRGVPASLSAARGHLTEPRLGFPQCRVALSPQAGRGIATS